ncbi:MAG: sorbosone dehydrogenase family protein [Rhodospirillaceae bacterium]
MRRAAVFALALWAGAAAAQAPVTPDPIPQRIAPSGRAAELVDVVRIPPSSPDPPRARLDFLTHAGDGSGRLFVVDMRGRIYVFRPGMSRPAVFLDLAVARGDRFLDDSREKGAKTIAFHPDYARRGAPGEGRFYTVSSERPDPALPALGEALMAKVNHVDVVAEWRVDPAAPDRADPSSRRELLRVAFPNFGHNVGQLAFDPTLRPGDAGYGMLYVGVGDGTFPPSGSRAQDLSAPLGKILRIDPRAAGSRAYAIPPDNPFAAQGGALGEVWAYGLRNPQRFGWDVGHSGAMLIADIGEDNVEEIDLGRAGANYGWPLREGRFVLDRANPETLYPLPADDARHGFVYPLAQYDHDEGRSIVGGYVYRGARVPDLAGEYVFGDLFGGRVFHATAADLIAGRDPRIGELTLLRDGRAVTLLSLMGDAPRADLRFGIGEDGEVYVLTKYDGMVRRFAPAAATPRR